MEHGEELIVCKYVHNYICIYNGIKNKCIYNGIIYIKKYIYIITDSYTKDTIM